MSMHVFLTMRKMFSEEPDEDLFLKVGVTYNEAKLKYYGQILTPDSMTIISAHGFGKEQLISNFSDTLSFIMNDRDKVLAKEVFEMFMPRFFYEEVELALSLSEMESLHNGKETKSVIAIGPWKTGERVTEKIPLVERPNSYGLVYDSD